MDSKIDVLHLISLNKIIIYHNGKLVFEDESSKISAIKAKTELYKLYVKESEKLTKAFQDSLAELNSIQEKLDE